MGFFKEHSIRIFLWILVVSVGSFIVYKVITLSGQKTSSFVNYEKQSLPGGWEVLFFEDKSLPYIRYNLFLPYGGSAFSPISKSGLAKFTLSLLDQGAGDWTSEEIQEKLNYYGTELDVRVDRENAHVILSGLSFHAETLWELFHAVVTKPHFLKVEVDSLKEKFVQGRLQTLDDKGHTAYEVWLRTLFSDESVSLPVIGTIPSIQNFSKEDIRNFYEVQILSASKILAVTGHFNKSLKKKILSSLSRGTDANTELVNRKTGIETKKQHLSSNFKDSLAVAPIFHFLTKSNLSQSEVLVGFPMKSFPKEQLREYLAFTLGNAAFGGNTLSSRLMTELRGEKGLTYGVYSMRAAKREYGFFIVDGNSRTKTTAVFLEGILSLLKDVKENGITEEELQRAKTKKKSDFLSQIETMESRSSNYLYYQYGLNVDHSFLDNYLSSIDKITLKEVNQALKDHIHWDRLHILVYGHPDIKEALNKVRPITQTLSFKDYFSKELSLDQKKKGI